MFLIELVSNMQSYQQDNGTAIEDYKEKFVPLSILIGIEIIFGLIGNSIVLFVFGFRYEYSVKKVFVVFLALFDLICCLTTLPLEIAFYLNWGRLKSDIFCKVKGFFNSFPKTAEFFILFAILMDKYNKIYSPNKFPPTQQIALCFCAFITLIAFLTALPVLEFVGKSVQVIANEDAVVCGIYESYKYLRRTPLIVYFYTSIFVRAIPGLMMIPLWFEIGCAIYKGWQAQSKDDKGLSERRGVYDSGLLQTFLVLIMSIFYVVTTGFTDFSDSFIIDDMLSLSQLNKTGYRFLYKLCMINHSINPFVFGFLDRDFSRHIGRGQNQVGTWTELTNSCDHEPSAASPTRPIIE